MKRVVVTGIGSVSGFGAGLNSLEDALFSGSSAIKDVTQFDVSDFPVKVAGEFSDFNPKDYFSSSEDLRMDRYCQFAMIAADEAIADANIEFGEDLGAETGVFIGSGMGGLIAMENNHTSYMNRGHKRISPYFIPSTIINTASGKISMKHKIYGPNFGHVSACSSSAHAIGEAFRYLKHGYLKAAVVGGAEATISPMGLGGFIVIKALSKGNSPAASRPFDKNRDGFVAGEGAGVLVIEEKEHALERGAKIYGEIVGYGASSDAFHITAPHAEALGAKACMESALKEANVHAQEIDYINAHGTSTPLNDKIETLAIKKVFGDFAHNVKISSTKSMTGHMLGAAGAIETIACLLSIQRQQIPPTINYEEKDPDCDLDYVPNKVIKRNIKKVMTNSFGFGGTNASLILSELSYE